MVESQQPQPPQKPQPKKSDSPFNKWYFWVVVGVFIIVVIGAVGGGGEETVKPTVTEKTTPTSTSITLTTKPKPKTLKQKVTDALAKIVGAENVKKVEIEKTDPDLGDPAGKKVVYLTYKTEAAGRMTFLHECTDIFQNEFKVNKDIYFVGLYPNGEVTDKYGKTKTKNWAFISMTRPINDKIDYENFDWTKLPIVADKYIEKVTIE